MAALTKYGALSRILLANSKSLVCFTRAASDGKPKWKRDYIPAPIPKTPEERRKAAEKYGIHPDEYKPMDEDNWTGDYPDLPLIGYDARDPYYPYDMPALRRNYMEPIAEHDDLVSEDRYSSMGERWKFNEHKAAIFGVILFIASVTVLTMQDPPHPQIMEKQYLQPGVVHYTFEPDS